MLIAYHQAKNLVTLYIFAITFQYLSSYFVVLIVEIFYGCI